MSNTFSSIFFHCVWSTKNRNPILVKPHDKLAYRLITNVVHNEGGNVIAIGGIADHVHLFIAVKPSESIARLVRNVKSISSKTLCKSDPELQNFAWQRGYSVFSVSSSRCQDVKKYIENQREHHKERSFEYELRALLKRHNVEYDERYLFG